VEQRLALVAYHHLKKGLLGAARPALRVALRALNVAARRRRTRLVLCRGLDRQAVSGLPAKGRFFVILVPAEGFEPPTYGLQNRCTTTVLSRHFMTDFSLRILP
jgi:hypothetical protein